MAVNGYSFSWNDVATGSPGQFVLGGIPEDVAKGIRFGLRQVPSITNVNAERIVESREAVPPGTS